MLFVVGVSRAMGVLNHVRKFQNKVCFIGAMYQGRKKLLHVIDCQHIMHVLAQHRRRGRGFRAVSTTKTGRGTIAFGKLLLLSSSALWFD